MLATLMHMYVLRFGSTRCYIQTAVDRGHPTTAGLRACYCRQGYWPCTHSSFSWLGRLSCGCTAQLVCCKYASPIFILHLPVNLLHTYSCVDVRLFESIRQSKSHQAKASMIPLPKGFVKWMTVNEVYYLAQNMDQISRTRCHDEVL